MITINNTRKITPTQKQRGHRFDGKFKMMKAEPVTDIKLPWDRHVYSIVPIKDGQFWACLLAHPDLLLIDRTGEVIQAVPIQGNCFFATADNQGNAVVSTHEGNSLIRVTLSNFTGNKIISGIKGLKSVVCKQNPDGTDDIFWAECCAGGGVMMQRHGECEKSNILPSASLYCLSCSRNEDYLSVVDLYKEDVIVFQTSGNITARYRKGIGFRPRGLCMDNQGCIIVANYGGEEILRIDKDGNLIQVLVEDLNDKPHGLCIDEDDRLWIGFSNGRMKVYQLEF